MEADNKTSQAVLGRIGAVDTAERPRSAPSVAQSAQTANSGDMDAGANWDHGGDNADLDVVADNAANPDAEPSIDIETPLILAVQHILSLSGIAFSAGAVRDLPELTSEQFYPKAAVSALRHVGFEANYGEMPVSTLEVVAASHPVLHSHSQGARCRQAQGEE